MKIKYFYLVIWLGLIVFASFTPSNKLPDFQLFKHADKVIHWGMYFGLSFLFIPALLKGQNYNSSYLLSFTIALLAGILIEYLQPIISFGRSAELSDGIADGIGAITGIIAYQLLIRNKKLEKIIFKIG
jgi:VanZ family protein